LFNRRNAELYGQFNSFGFDYSLFECDLFTLRLGDFAVTLVLNLRISSVKNIMSEYISETGYDITRLDADTIENLASDLNDEERRVLLEHGTEAPFCGTLLDNKLDGVYACRLCGLPLFTSRHKFDSGTGWPSFHSPFDKEHLEYIEDNSYGMRRTEIRCARCGGHQGHVFPDGPPPTGQRYCLNSASLEFFPDGEEIPQKG